MQSVLNMYLQAWQLSQNCLYASALDYCCIICSVSVNLCKNYKKHSNACSLCAQFYYSDHLEVQL